MTLYAVRFPTTSDAVEDAEVVNESPYGWAFLEQAVALWRLVDPARATAIEAIKDRASDAPGDYTRFNTTDAGALADLIGDVDVALIAAGVVDAHWRVDPARLPELTRQVPGLSPTTMSLPDRDHALAEVMINAVSVRNFFAHAKRDGCVVIHA